MNRDAVERPERIVGLAAAYAVMRARPADVLTIAHAASARRELRELLREAARRRIAYREVDEQELERIASTVHHEGVCLSVRPRARVELAELARAVARSGVLVALDHVENPHNVGALLRSAAYFGARGLLLASPRERALTPAAVRVAEGGAEFVPTCLVPSLAEPLAELQETGVRVIGADAHRGEPATRFRFPTRAVIAFGSERHGLAPEVERCCDALVHIPGTDAIESLNVSVAAGILLALATDGARTSQAQRARDGAHGEAARTRAPAHGGTAQTRATAHGNQARPRAEAHGDAAGARGAAYGDRAGSRVDTSPRARRGARRS